MARIRASDQVCLPDGTIATLGALPDPGRARVPRSDNWRRRGGRSSTAYFANLIDGSGSWEIDQKLFGSRLAAAPALTIPDHQGA